jgi:hypothetical protein
VRPSSKVVLSALLGGGSEHAQAFFAIAALSAGGSALLALRLGGASSEATWRPDAQPATPNS